MTELFVVAGGPHSAEASVNPMTEIRKICLMPNRPASQPVSGIIIAAPHVCPPADFQIFPDQAITVAGVDRVVHHATIFEMNVESYRRRAALECKRSRGPPAGPRDNHGQRLIAAPRHPKPNSACATITPRQSRQCASYPDCRATDVVRSQARNVFKSSSVRLLRDFDGLDDPQYCRVKPKRRGWGNAVLHAALNRPV